MNYEKELSLAIELAKTAGKAIMEFFGKNLDSEIKEDGSPVTLADLKSNEIIVKGITENFPKDGIISEELEKQDGERMWFVDPLDGTKSFMMNSTEFAIHIGLSEKCIPVMGVVYKPGTGELYYAIKNEGAYKISKDKDKEKLEVSNKIDSNIVAIIPYDSIEQYKKEGLFQKIKISSFKEVPATGLKFMAIAENKGDLFLPLKSNFKSWDLCAPQIILEEAGGKVKCVNGRKMTYEHRESFSKPFVALGAYDKDCLDEVLSFIKF